MTPFSRILLLCCLSVTVHSIVPAVLFAQVEASEEAPVFRPNEKPILNAVRTSTRIVVDGRIDESAWSDAALAENFSETYPGERTQPPIGIRARLMYDDDNLYIAFQIRDDPRRVRASLCDRDEIWNDDYCGIILYTYGDATWGYFIAANPLGIQGETRLSSSSGEEVSFDLVYSSAGRITDEGYEIEMAVPFSSLRFPERPVQDWRGTFWITHPRESRSTYSWASYRRNDPCELCQAGTFAGIAGVVPGSNLEILPAFVSRQSSALESDAQGNTRLSHDDIKGEPSLGLRYTFSSSTSAEAAVNPDYSQVESDPSQIDINTTFALYYDERRPFFQEGSDLLRTPITAVYTRSINNPLVAAKFTSRFGRTGIQYLGAYDETSPVILPFEEQSAILQNVGASTVSILRAKHSFLEDSFVGLLLADRRYEKIGSGSLAGIDGMVRFLTHYKIRAQGLLSRTAEAVAPEITAGTGIDAILLDEGRHSTRFDGEKFLGHAYRFSVEREAEAWSWEWSVSETSPLFRASTGFVTQAARRQVNVWNGYTFYPASGFIDRITPNLSVGRVWNTGGIIKDEWIMPELSIQMKGMTNLTLGWLTSDELFRNTQLNGIRRGSIRVNSNFSEPVRAGFFVMYGRTIARSLAVPVLGRGTEVSLWASIKPMQNVKIEPEYAFQELNHPETNANLFRGYILRTRVSYQFTRELFLRLVVEYNDFSRSLAVEPLLTYRLNPFSIFYVGSTHGLYELPSVIPSDDMRRPWEFGQNSRQFFLKFQYLFQV